MDNRTMKKSMNTGCAKLWQILL